MAQRDIHDRQQDAEQRRQLRAAKKVSYPHEPPQCDVCNIWLMQDALCTAAAHISSRLRDALSCGRLVCWGWGRCLLHWWSCRITDHILCF